MARPNEAIGKECPLCLEPFDADDVAFFPCQCEYQVCRFCWHRIRVDENGLCPACRAPYAEDPVNFNPVATEVVEKMRTQRRKTNLLRRQQQINERQSLNHLRIVPRNLIVVSGIPANKAKEDVLRRADYFGQFGKIVKISFKNKSCTADDSSAKAITTAFITFQKEEDAFKAVCRLDHAELDGQAIRVTLGTTKYCSFFLKGIQCHRTNCMYMHEAGDEAARFTAEDMDQGRHVEFQQKLIREFTEKMKRAQSKSNQRLDEGSKKKTSHQAVAADVKEPKKNKPIACRRVLRDDLTTAGSTEKLASSWGTNSSAGQLDSDRLTDGGVNLVPSYSLPIYSQSMLDDPKQPVIHIGHCHHEHECCSYLCNETSETALNDLSLSWQRALNLCEEDGLKNGYFSNGCEVDVEGGRLLGAADAWTSQTNVLSPAISEQNFDIYQRSEIGTLYGCRGEPPPASLCQAPPGHWFDRPLQRDSPLFDDAARFATSQYDRFGRCEGTQSFETSATCLENVAYDGAGAFREAEQILGPSSLPGRLRNIDKHQISEYDEPYVRLQQLHEPTTSYQSAADIWR